jgi:hypothetical protein
MGADEFDVNPIEAAHLLCSDAICAAYFDNLNCASTSVCIPRRSSEFEEFV